MQNMKRCSRCEKSLPNASFTSKQLKTKASARFCIACTQGTGTLHACFSQATSTTSEATSTAAGERPSQVVHERTVASTPKGQDVVVAIERCSTGGTRREAHYERPISGSMSGSQRKAKTRARTLLFPDKEAAAREQNTGRMAELRAADREFERQSTQSSIGTIWWAMVSS